VAGLLGRKLGMTQVFAEDGRVDRVTVIEAGPCFVTGIRRADRDGYDAVQVAFGEVREKRLNKPKLGHLKKAGVPPLRHVCEFRGDPGELEVGAELKLEEAFEKGQHVKVSGASKGKGFAGTIKRHNFHRGPGQMGNKRVTQRGLEIVDVRPEEKLLLVRGSVPGSKGAVVEIRSDP
jgi:large subunit ribosomal protein L3